MDVPIIYLMNGISGASSASSAISAKSSTESQVAIAMLRKTLDAQKSQGAELLKLLEGKGQIIDIRA